MQVKVMRRLQNTLRKKDAKDLGLGLIPPPRVRVTVESERNVGDAILAL
jgi:hypothetical protein